MFSFVAPPVWRTLVSISFDYFATASPQRLESRANSPGGTVGPHSRADALDLRALVVMGDQAAPIVVLDLDEILMASNAMQLLRRCKLVKERRERREALRGHARDARQDVRMERLGRDSRDVRGKRLDGRLGGYKDHRGRDRGSTT